MKIVLLILSIIPGAAYATESFVGLWQFPEREVWVRISKDNTVLQCRIDTNGKVIEAKGKLRGVTIYWDKIWDKDVLTIENEKLFLKGKYGKFGFERSHAKMAEKCLNRK